MTEPTDGEAAEPTEREWLEGLRYEDRHPEPDTLLGVVGDGAAEAAAQFLATVQHLHPRRPGQPTVHVVQRGPMVSIEHPGQACVFVDGQCSCGQLALGVVPPPT